MKTFRQFLTEAKQTLKEGNNRAHIYFRKDLSDKEKNEIKKMIQGANVAFNDLLKNGYHPIYTDKNSLKDRWNKYADKILFEADLGIVEPGLDKNDDEPYNTPLVKIDEAVEYVELPYLMRKPNDLEDLKRFHNKHKNDPKEKYMVVYTMELTNDEYNEWTGSFLGDFPFGKIFKKYGGTSKDGKTTEVVRVKSKNKPTLYVDPEGYDYARYVALEK